MLVAHVAAGIAEAFPGVASALPPGGSPEDQIAALSNELVATIPDDFVLALDDVHALEEGPVADALALLAADLPPNVHLAMTGRRALGASIARVAAGGVTVIGEEELAFSFDEAAALLEDAPGGLAEAEIGEVHQRTEGWVAGLLLATRSGGMTREPRHGGHRRRPLRLPGRGGARAAARRHPALPARHLRAGALHGGPRRGGLGAPGRARGHPRAWSTRTCSSSRPRGAGTATTTSSTPSCAATWPSASPRSSPELHLRAGRAWEASGDHQEAVRHFLEAGAMEEAAAALEQVAEAMVADARAPDAGRVARPHPRERLAPAAAHRAGRARC